MFNKKPPTLGEDGFLGWLVGWLMV